MQNQAEWSAAFVAFILWYARYEFSGNSSIAGVARAGPRELAAARASYGSLPPWVFGVVWTVVYAANSVGTYLFWKNGGETGKYALVWALLLGNVLVNKAWSAVFADARLYTAGAVTIFLNFALAVALLITLLVEGSGALGYAPFALFLPYTLWLFVAFVLNVKFARAYTRIASARRASARRQQQMPGMAQMQE